MAFPLLKSIIFWMIIYQRFPRHMIMLMIVARTMADVTMMPTGTVACAIILIPLVFVARPVYSIPLIIVVPRSLPSLPGPSGRAGEGREVFSFMF